MRNRSKGWLWTREVVTLPARNHESSADLEWQWTLRADGSVWWRLTRVRGREEHNDWQYAGELDKAGWNALAAGQLTPADYLETCARDHGHRLAVPRHRQPRLGKCPACGALAAEERDGTLQPHQRPSQDWPARFVPCAGPRPKRR
jgi:hypothetical protein